MRSITATLLVLVLFATIIDSAKVQKKNRVNGTVKDVDVPEWRSQAQTGFLLYSVPKPLLQQRRECSPEKCRTSKKLNSRKSGLSKPASHHTKKSNAVDKKTFKRDLTAIQARENGLNFSKGPKRHPTRAQRSIRNMNMKNKVQSSLSKSLSTNTSSDIIAQLGKSNAKPGTTVKNNHKQNNMGNGRTNRQGSKRQRRHGETASSTIEPSMPGFKKWHNFPIFRYHKNGIYKFYRDQTADGIICGNMDQCFKKHTFDSHFELDDEEDCIFEFISGKKYDANQAFCEIKDAIAEFNHKCKFKGYGRYTGQSPSNCSKAFGSATKGLIRGYVVDKKNLPADMCLIDGHNKRMVYCKDLKPLDMKTQHCHQYVKIGQDNILVDCELFRNKEKSEGTVRDTKKGRKTGNRNNRSPQRPTNTPKNKSMQSKNAELTAKLELDGSQANPRGDLSLKTLDANVPQSSSLHISQNPASSSIPPGTVLLPNRNFDIEVIPITQTTNDKPHLQNNHQSSGVASRTTESYVKLLMLPLCAAMDRFYAKILPNYQKEYNGTVMELPKIKADEIIKRHMLTDKALDQSVELYEVDMYRKSWTAVKNCSGLHGCTFCPRRAAEQLMELYDNNDHVTLSRRQRIMDQIRQNKDKISNLGHDGSSSQNPDASQQIIPKKSKRSGMYHRQPRL